MPTKVKLYCCPKCGLEMTKIEAIKSRGRCTDCSYGNKDGERLKYLGEVTREDVLEEVVKEDIFDEEINLEDIPDERYGT